jgi:hypothetical protein
MLAVVDGFADSLVEGTVSRVSMFEGVPLTEVAPEESHRVLLPYTLYSCFIISTGCV